MELIPLVTIGAELGISVDRLADKFGDDVINNDIGIRAIPSETAREFITAHRAAVKAAREQAAARHAELAARPNPYRERVKALAAAQAKYDGDPSASALERALAKDPDSNFNRSARRLDEMLAGEMVMHRIRPKRED